MPWQSWHLWQLKAPSTGCIKKYERCAITFRICCAAPGELVRITAPGKHLVLIAGDSYRRGVTIPTSAALCEMACSAGFELERKLVRRQVSFDYSGFTNRQYATGKSRHSRSHYSGTCNLILRSPRQEKTSCFSRLRCDTLQGRKNTLRDAHQKREVHEASPPYHMG